MCLVLYIPLLVRLVPMAGGSAHPLCTTARLRGRDSGAGACSSRVVPPTLEPGRAVPPALSPAAGAGRR
jgi:hypothetical protein